MCVWVGWWVGWMVGWWVGWLVVFACLLIWWGVVVGGALLACLFYFVLLRFIRIHNNAGKVVGKGMANASINLIELTYSRESNGRRNHRYMLFDTDMFPYSHPVTKR